MVFRRSNPNPGRGAFTLVELLVAVAVGSFVVTASVLFFILSVRSFTAMCNYVDLNDQSRNTTDVLSRDIRCAYSVDPTTTTNKLVLTYPGGTNVTYTYDSGLKTLTRTVGGKAQTMLKQVVGGTFAFSLWQRPTNSAAYGTFPAATAATAKLVSFRWSCSRTVANYPSDSESLQMAMVELRNE